MGQRTVRVGVLTYAHPDGSNRIALAGEVIELTDWSAEHLDSLNALVVDAQLSAPDAVEVSEPPPTTSRSRKRVTTTEH